MVADFNKKEKGDFFNDKLLFKTVGIVFLVVICVLAVADFRIYQKKKELNLQISIYKKQIEDIKKSSQTLKAEIENSDNVDYLEKLGYEQLDQTRPGETEYMFVKSPEKTETVSKQNSFQNIGSWFGWIPKSLNWIKSKF